MPADCTDLDNALQPTVVDAPRRRNRVLRYGGISCALFLTLCIALYVFRTPWLSGLAELWVVDDPIEHADALVILGGRPDLRAPEAARLHHQGVAPKILYMNVKFGPSVELGIIPSESEQTRRLLLSDNVPDTGMVAIGQAVASTYDESRATRAWAGKAGAKSVLVITDLAHTRRARWIFRKELSGTGVDVHVHAVAPKEYGTSDWWRHEEGLIAFQNEVIKSVFYWCKYEP